MKKVLDPTASIENFGLTWTRPKKLQCWPYSGPDLLVNVVDGVRIFAIDTGTILQMEPPGHFSLGA